MGPGSFDPGNMAGWMHRKDPQPASMGPGSFDPGNNRHARGDAPVRALQWGRGLSTPEIGDVPATVVPHPDASMGPGSFDPGNDFDLGSAGQKRIASMGPGSFDPGNRRTLARTSLIAIAASMGPGSFDPGNGGGGESPPPFFDPGFNGAGVFRPRKYQGWAPRNTPSSSFNGAGVFRPRK